MLYAYAHTINFCEQTKCKNEIKYRMEDRNIVAGAGIRNVYGFLRRCANSMRREKERRIRKCMAKEWKKYENCKE